MLYPFLQIITLWYWTTL